MGKKTNRRLTIALGILMLFCGVVALGSPFIMGAMMTTMIGIMLIMGGVAEMIISFSNGWKAGLPLFLAGILTLIAGGIVLGQPILASAMFTIMMVIYFISEGILRSIYALQSRPIQGWGFLLFSGITSILLGIMLMRHWPLSGLMAIGVFAGVRLLFAGISLLNCRSIGSASLKASIL